MRLSAREEAKIRMSPGTHHAAAPSRAPSLRQIPFMSLHHKVVYIPTVPEPHEMTSIVIFTKIVAKTYLENNES
jgi:hypothetical protein